MIFPLIVLSIPSIIWNTSLSYSEYFIYSDVADCITVILSSILEHLYDTPPSGE